MSHDLSANWNQQPGVFLFHCPGCGFSHSIRYEGAGMVWKWDGNRTQPTFAPSLLVRGGHYIPDHKPDTCWCTYNKEHPDQEAPYRCTSCHSFIRSGRIEFLSDCSHDLAGQTVEIPPWGERVA